MAARKAALGLLSDRAASEAYGLLGGLYPASGPAPVRGTKELLEGYRSMPWLRALANKVGVAVASTEWELYKPSSGKRDKPVQRMITGERHAVIRAAVNAGRLKPVENHILLDAIADANSFLVGHSLFLLTQIHLDLVGEAFWIKERNGIGAPVGFWPIPPHWVRETPTVSHRSFKVAWSAWHGDIPDTEIVWFVDVDPANPYGRGAGLGQALGDELETDEFAAKHVKQTFLNRARPDLIIWPEETKFDAGTIDDANARRLAEKWRAEHQGFWRASLPYFATRKLGVKELSQSFQELQLTELRKHERDCYDAETECLTARGWIAGPDLRDDDEVATWDEHSESLRYIVPNRIVKYHATGPMHHWANARVNVMVTPNHRMWVWRPDGWIFLRSDETLKEDRQHWRTVAPLKATGDNVVTIPFEPYVKSAVWRNVRPKDGVYTLDALLFAKWLGYWISEGYASPQSGRCLLEYVQALPLGVTEPTGTTADMIDASDYLTRCGLGQTHTRKASRPTKRGRTVWRVTISNKSLWTWVRTHCGFGSRQKRIPRCVFTWTKEAKTALLNAMIAGDGHRCNPHMSWIATASKGLADDIQELCVQLGLYASIRTNTDKNHHPAFTVTVSSNQDTTEVSRKACTVVDYDGIIWCPDVGGRPFVTRRRGRIAVHGNTIIQIWGVPPEEMGIIENSNRATIDTADFLFKRNVVVPRLELLRAYIQERLIPEYDDALIINYKSPVQADKDFQLKAAEKAPWALTVDEHREFMGREPLPDGKGAVHMVNLKVQPRPTLDYPPPLVTPSGTPTNAPSSDTQRRALAARAEWRDALDACIDAGDVEAEALIRKELTDAGVGDDTPPIVDAIAAVERIAATLDAKIAAGVATAIGELRNAIDRLAARPVEVSVPDREVHVHVAPQPTVKRIDVERDEDGRPSRLTRIFDDGGQS